MAGGDAERADHPPRAFPNRLSGRKKRRWIEIALQRHASGGKAPRLARIARPIEADRVAAARQHFREPGISALGKQDARHAHAVFLLDQAGDDLAAVREREGFVVAAREAAAPRV